MAVRELEVYARLALDVVAAEGSELVLADGRRVLDLYGGHCVNTLGAADEEVAGAFGEQWRRLSFVTNLLDHPPREAFVEALGANLPPGEWRVFLGNSGAEANENALKAALGATSRERVVCFEGAFHGRTAAAAAISDVARSGFPRDPFELTRLPWGDGAAARAAIDDTVAAVVLEPIQSMAGVRVPPDGFLGELRAACDASGAVLIFDEVQTGNGRTGRPFAAQTLGVTPDVLVTAKGAAGGLPIGITVLSAALAAELPGGILGSTFGGGPSVLAAACVVQRRIGEPAFARHVREVSAALGEAALRGPVREVRGAGLLLGAVLDLGVDAGGVRGALLEHGILVGTSNDQSVLRLTPPLTLTLEEAARLGDALESIDGAA